MKILTVCQGGNIRSVALACRLKSLHGHDALACSRESNSPETIKMLCTWADMVVVMEPEYADCIPMEFRGKLHICDVGPDRWGAAFRPELQDLIAQKGISKF